MASEVGREDFVSGRCGETYNRKFGLSVESHQRTSRARSLVWERLSAYAMRAVRLRHYRHFYWSDQENAQQHVALLRETAEEKLIHHYLQMDEICLDDGVVLNSWLKVNRSLRINCGSVVYHTSIDAQSLHVGSNCFLNGFKIYSPRNEIVIPDESVVIGFIVSLPNEETSFQHINVIFGVTDLLMVSISDNRSTFCNYRWKQIFDKTGLCAEDIWDKNLDDEKKTLLNAKLYSVFTEISECFLFFKQEGNWDADQRQRWRMRKRFSISDILKFNNYGEVYKYRRELFALIAFKEISNILLNNKDSSLLPFFRLARAEGWDKTALNILDEVCMKSANETRTLSRSLSSIADLLGIMAGKSGGVRTGPGNNRLWTSAFNLLQEGKFKEGLQLLKSTRDQWLDRPHHIIRAARHYESALQIVIHGAVKTINQFIRLSKIPLLPFDRYVTVECPARVDLQGGWTDTPPICYEMGGSVVNMAVLIDGKKPIGAKACRITNLEIKLIVGNVNESPVVIINDIDQLTNYNQPNAEAALLKAAIIYVGLINVNGNVCLSEQLERKYGGGFKIQTWSLLPQGSGMGTSSIMASAVLSALWTITGHGYDNGSVLHAVLELEQLLTTGGGWQDQVGGVMGGIKRGYSLPTLPLCIQTQEIRVGAEFLQKLNQHLLLVYTGKVRLAKNLLQNVVRNWYAREEKVIGCFRSLIDNSMDMMQAFQSEELEKIGKLLDTYWEQKMQLAPGCQPTLVAEMISELRPLALGQCLVGAGGGGFLCLLTQQPDQADSVREAIARIQGSKQVTVHRLTICQCGAERVED